jgi:hypothetical protein
MVVLCHFLQKGLLHLLDWTRRPSLPPPTQRLENLYLYYIKTSVSTVVMHYFLQKKSLTSFGMNPRSAVHTSALFVLSPHAIQQRMPSPPISCPPLLTWGVTTLASRRFCDCHSFNRKHLSLPLYNTRVSSDSSCVNALPREHPRPPRACLRLHQNSRHAIKYIKWE